MRRFACLHINKNDTYYIFTKGFLIKLGTFSRLEFSNCGFLGFSGACEDAGMPPEVNFLFRKFLLQQHTDPGSERLVMVGRVHGVVVKCGPVFLMFFCPSLLDFKGYTDIWYIYYIYTYTPFVSFSSSALRYDASTNTTTIEVFA